MDCEPMLATRVERRHCQLTLEETYLGICSSRVVSVCSRHKQAQVRVVERRRGGVRRVMLTLALQSDVHDPTRTPGSISRDKPRIHQFSCIAVSQRDKRICSSLNCPTFLILDAQILQTSTVCCTGISVEGKLKAVDLKKTKL